MLWLLSNHYVVVTFDPLKLKSWGAYSPRWVILMWWAGSEFALLYMHINCRFSPIILQEFSGQFSQDVCTVDGFYIVVALTLKGRCIEQGCATVWTPQTYIRLQVCTSSLSASCSSKKKRRRRRRRKKERKKKKKRSCSYLGHLILREVNSA